MRPRLLPCVKCRCVLIYVELAVGLLVASAHGRIGMQSAGQQDHWHEPTRPVQYTSPDPSVLRTAPTFLLFLSFNDFFRFFLSLLLDRSLLLLVLLPAATKQ